MPTTPFQTEAWTEYGLGSLVFMLRYFARRKTVGFKGWGADDLFACLALVFWTVSHRYLCRANCLDTTNGSFVMQAELVMLELIGMCLRRIAFSLYNHQHIPTRVA